MRWNINELIYGIAREFRIRSSFSRIIVDLLTIIITILLYIFSWIFTGLVYKSYHWTIEFLNRTNLSKIKKFRKRYVIFDKRLREGKKVREEGPCFFDMKKLEKQGYNRDEFNPERIRQIFINVLDEIVEGYEAYFKILNMGKNPNIKFEYSRKNINIILSDEEFEDGSEEQKILEQYEAYMEEQKRWEIEMEMKYQNALELTNEYAEYLKFI